MSTQPATTRTVSDEQRTAALFGLALGDAWGYEVEFRSYARILAEHGRRGPDFPTRPLISDDCQMSLATWDALTASVHANGSYVPDQVGRALAAQYRAWSVDRDNNRAPGSTCMGACRRLTNPGKWTTAGIGSMGCGTVMRAPWIGLHPHVLPADIGPLADLSAVITHTHPGAVAAAHATAVLTHTLATGQVEPGSCARWLLDYALSVGPMMWTTAPGLDLHPVTASTAQRAAYRDEGWTRIESAAVAAEHLADELAQRPWEADPCELLPLGGRGREGWDAVSCLALAVGILDGMDVHTHDGDRHQGHDTIRRAVTTGGDSDSIAAVVGALAGAAYGSSALGAVRLDTLEDRYLLAIDRRAVHGMGAVAPAPVFA